MALAGLDRPAMGWNSWNCLRCANLTETAVVEMADALVASGMRAAGYRYVVVDDCWQAHRRGPDGRLRAHPGRFPSGMAALGEELHRRGLGFGLYLAPGRRTCAEIYDRYGERGGLGSFGHEELDLDTLLSWGVDYLKYDWCQAGKNGTGLREPEAFGRMSALIAGAERDVVFSVSEYGRSRPWEWAPGVAHSWRTTGDISPHWWRMLRIAHRTAGCASASAAAAEPGRIGRNDPDMLEVGNGRLVEDAAWSHMAMWAMLGAPLMAGNDLRTMTGETHGILTDPVLIAVDQDGSRTPARLVRSRMGLDVWSRDLVDGPALLVVNTLSFARRVNLAELTGHRLQGATLHTRDRETAWAPEVRLPGRGAVLAVGHTDDGHPADGHRAVRPTR
ncbi:glycoside hydrolase family 27 protein [Streptomyces sp. NPDC127039]|uniref:glycoside hydrolase family 27 protein n=1 Tax=Streptomyces sp. NPDC127039 TaxID=3347115 RepID=UPI0036603A51